jgi:translation initiation factor 5B
LNVAILGFNVAVSSDLSGKIPSSIKVITGNIIYSIMDEFISWQHSEQQRLDEKALEKIARPCKIQLLKGYVFRQSNPAIVGVEILGGSLSVGMQLMKNNPPASDVGKVLTSVKEIQLEKENVSTAKKGGQVAVSLDNVIIGRQLNEGDVLITVIHEDDFRKLKEFKKSLSSEEIDLLRELSEVMRRDNPLWGV